MNKHLDSQLLRFLKAYYKINSTPIIDIDKIDTKAFIEPLYSNNWLDSTSQPTDSDICLSLPEITDCPQPPIILDSWLKEDFNNPDILSIPHKSHLVINDPINTTYIDFNENPKRVEAYNDYHKTRVEWINSHKRSLKALNSYQNITLLFTRYTSTNTDKILLLGNGLLKLENNKTNINFPLILQPASLTKNSKGNYIIRKIDKPYFNTEVLTAIPGISVKAIEESINLFESETINLLGDIKLQLFLAQVFKLATSGNNNFIQINNSPVLFLNSNNYPYREFITKTMNTFSKQLNGSLESLLSAKENNNLHNMEDDYVHLKHHFLIKYDLNSLNALKILSEENFCVLNAPTGTEKEKIINNTISHYLHSGKRVLVISPYLEYLNRLKDKLSSDNNKILDSDNLNSLLTDRDTLINSLITTKENLIEKYHYIEENINNDTINQMKSNPLEHTFDTDNTENDAEANQLYWDDDAVYRKGLLSELLIDIDSLLLEEFTRLPATRLIADQIKMAGLNQKWKELIKHIQEYRVYIKEFPEALSNKGIEINSFPNLGLLLKNITDITLHIERKGKLRKLDYKFNRAWNEIVNNCSINKKKPYSLEDFLALQLFVEKIIYKTKILREWSDIASPLGLPKLPANDSLLEEAINYYYTPIINSINWFTKNWQPFIAKLINTGFNWKEFFNSYGQQYIENGFVNTLYNQALADLKDLIKHRINFTKEFLNSNFYEATQSSSEDCELPVRELAANLSKLTDILHDLQDNSEKMLAYYPSNNLSLITWPDFLKSQLENPQIFDLIIIDSAEQMDVFGILALYFTKKCLFIGDVNQTIESSRNIKTTTIELSKSLLNGIINSEIFCGNYNLLEMIIRCDKKQVNLTENIINPPCITRFISKLCYDSKLLARKNSTGLRSMFSINVLKKVANNDEISIINYLKYLITEISGKKNSGTIAIIDMEGDYFANSLIDLKGLDKNIEIGSLKTIAGSKYDIVIGLDLRNSIKNSLTVDKTYPQKLKFNIVLGATKAVFCYIFDSSSLLDNASNIQSDLIQYIDKTKDVLRVSNINSQLLFDKLAPIISDFNVKATQNTMVNGRPVDILLHTSKPITVIDIHSNASKFSELFNWHLSLSRSGYTLLFADFSGNHERIMENVREILNQNCFEIRPAEFSFADFLDEIDFNWNNSSSNYPGKLTETQSDKEAAVSLFSNIVVSKKEVTKPLEEDSSKQKFSSFSFGENKIDKEEKDQTTGKLFRDTKITVKGMKSNISTAESKLSLTKPLKKIKIDKKYQFSISDSAFKNKAALFNFGSTDAYLDESSGLDNLDNKGSLKSSQDIIQNKFTSNKSIEIAINESNNKKEAVSKEVKCQSNNPISEKNIELTTVNTPASLKKSIIEVSKFSHPQINNGNFTKEIVGFDPDKDTYDNMYLKTDFDHPNDKENSFELINWLNENSHEYIDLRPSGKLWVIDKPNMRLALRGLRAKGLYFSLSIKSSELPDNCSAWGLIEN